MRLGASWSSVLPGLAAGSVAGLVVALIVVVVGDDGDASLDEAALGEVVEAAVEPLVEEVVADFDRAVEAAVTQAVSEALAQRAAEAGSLVATAVAGVLPGVVIVDAEGALERDEFGNLVAPAALATGLILDEAGFVLTNEHVIRDAVLISVILADGRRLEAE
ncbi:MAG TPA: hypothetical protein QGF05_10090, partial [Dehalococcoidia bacterium]|nr:hypothetical protein [Dehalococcoidia bacterium]